MFKYELIKKVYPCLILIVVYFCIQNQALTQTSNTSREEDAIKITGNIGISTVFFNADGRETNRQPFTYVLRGNPIISLYGVDVPISIIVSEQERDFRQPFNRFGINPLFKGVQFNLGYQNLNYSKYSLAGHAMVGAGFEASPGKIRLGYMYGRLLRAVQPNTIIEDSEFTANPSYARNGQVAKIGYGSKTNFVDLILLTASDNDASIDSIPSTYGLQPEDNAVVSLVSEQKIGQSLLARFEYAQSSYTNDTRSELNEDPQGVFSIFSFLTDSRNSTEVSSAIDASIDFNSGWFGTRVQFERISPNYRSMGAYFFLSDMQKITLEPRIKLLNNKVTLNTSFGFQKNNLSNQKNLQTNRSIGSVRINARVSNSYTVNGHFSNFGVSQREGIVPVNEDNLVSQVTNNWGINQNFQLTGTTYLHNAMMSFQRQQLSDDNPNTSTFTNYHNTTLFLNYNFSYLPKRLGSNISYTHSKFSNETLETTYQGPNISANASFLNNALRLSIGQSFLRNISNDILQRKINKTSVRATYKLNRAQKVSFRMYINKSTSSVQTLDSFTENKIDLQYVYQFR